MTNATMQVICLKDTGHVLAALTTTATNEAAAIADIVGSELMVTSARNVNAGNLGLRPMRSPVPTSLLEVKTAPFATAAIANPLAYAINGGAVVKLPNGPAPGGAPALDTNSIILTGGIADTVGFCVVSNAQDPSGDRRIQSGTFVNNGGVQPLDLPLTLMPGDTPASSTGGVDYDIMTAIQGARLFWDAATP